MEPFEKNELDDRELDAVLAEWRVPEAPERMRQAIFPPEGSWWRRLWSASIRVPLPVAVGLALLLALAVWQPWRVPARRTELPAVAQDAHELRPVAVLRP